MNALDALAKVNVLMEAKHYQEALNVLESVLGAEPANLDALEYLRQLLDRTGQYAAAVQWLSRFLENHPFHLNSAFYSAGHSYLVDDAPIGISGVVAPISDTLFY